MLKLYRNILAGGLLAAGLAACGSKVTVTNPPPPPAASISSVTVAPSTATINVGGHASFAAAVIADSSGIPTTVSWTTANTAVATVDASGNVTGVAPGTTAVIATSTYDHNKSGVGSVTVQSLPANIAGIQVTPSNAAIAVGGTLQANANVQLTAGAPAATIAWTSSNTAIATVGAATGTITGVATGTAIITATATSGTQTAAATMGVNVGSGPTGLISFTVAPAGVTLFAGQTQQETATIVMGTGFTAPAVTWSSLAPSVATVSATGLITAVAQGTAVVNATIGTAPNTVTQSVAVTVGAAASISINSVNAGASAGHNGCSGVVGAPVLLTNVNCQIDVNLNVQPGVQRADSITVWFVQGAVTKKLWSQQFGGTIPAAGNLTASIVSSNFTKNAATGLATVDLWNGPTQMIVKIWPTGGGSGSASDCQIGAGNPDPTCTTLSMIFNNADGWAADVTKCDSVISASAVCPAANPAAGTGGFATDVNGSGANLGKTYWGGPGSTGQVAAELYAVVYNDNPADASGSTLNRCNNTLGNGSGCIKTVTWTIGSNIASCPGLTQVGFGVGVAVAPTPLFRQVFGTSGANLTTNCNGHQNILAHRDNVFVVAGTAQDAEANQYPTASVNTLIPNTVVFGATPDSLRLDWAAPSVSTPSITRVTPAVTGWVNAAFSFAGFGVSDAGVGPAPSTAATSYTSVNCPTVVAVNVNMPHQTGADINGGVACPTNFIGGTPGLGGTAPWTVKATETDLLGNLGTSSASSTFGTDYTPPAIRWGLVDAGIPLVKSYGLVPDTGSATVDSAFGAATSGAYSAKPVAGTNIWRAEFLDDRSGFYNTGVPDGFGVSAQMHELQTANHVNSTGSCSGFAGPGSTDPLFGTTPVSATFVTAEYCTLVFTSATVGTIYGVVRTDGWQPGIQVNIPPAEGYYGYWTNVTDAAGNVSSTLKRRVLVNTRVPFSTGLGIPAVLTSTTFNFLATGSDSAELSHQSLELVYPNIPTVDSLRYARVKLPLSGQFGCGAIAVTAYMDDCISSPYSGNIQPVWGNTAVVTPLATQTPYVRGIEIVDGTAFGPAATNTSGTASFAAAKPTQVLVWAWNWGGAGLPTGFPQEPGNVLPTASNLIAIPALNVQNGASIASWNAANPTIAINYWRVIQDATTGNEFGSTVPLRAQAVSPTDAPNPPFSRVDFYRLMNGAAVNAGSGTPTHWSYLGSVPGNVFSCTGLGVCASDQGTYRSWVYELPNASFVNAWNTVAIQGALASTNRIIAVGVVSTGDALSSAIGIMP